MIKHFSNIDARSSLSFFQATEELKRENGRENRRTVRQRVGLYQTHYQSLSAIDLKWPKRFLESSQLNQDGTLRELWQMFQTLIDTHGWVATNQTDYQISADVRDPNWFRNHFRQKIFAQKREAMIEYLSDDATKFHREKFDFLSCATWRFWRFVISSAW